MLGLRIWESLFQSFQNREKNTLLISFPYWSTLILPSRRLYLLRGELPNLLQVIDELESVFFWWFGFFGHAELVVCWRLPSILWHTCICFNRVTEERQALLGRVSEVNLEFLDQRSVWFYLAKVLLVLYLWTHLFLLKNRTKTLWVRFYMKILSNTPVQSRRQWQFCVNSCGTAVWMDSYLVYKVKTLPMYIVMELT